MKIGDLVVFGPGSEWLWSMLQLVVVAVSLFGVYFQLRQAAAQSAINQLNGFEAEWNSERMVRHRLAVMVHLRDAQDPSHPPSFAATAVMNYWERLATLARRRHLDRHLLWSTVGLPCRWWWQFLAPAIERERDEFGIPNLLEDFEWLNAFCLEQDRRAGRPVVITEASLASLRDLVIPELVQQIEIEETLRGVPH